MPKLDLTRLDRLKMAGGEVAAIKGAGFDWARPLAVIRVQLDTAIDGGTFAIVNSGITYTLADSTFNVDVSGVTSMDLLFSNSTFNGNINYWNVSNVTNMDSMFYFASSFNQPLDSWDVSNVTDMRGMFHFCGMSPENYSRTLIGWANRAYNGGLNDGVQTNTTLVATGCQYNATTYTDTWPNLPGQQFTDAVSARTYLVNTMGWTITDGGQV